MAGASALQRAADARGTATVEYVLVLALIGVIAALAIVGLGALLLQLYRFQQLVLLLPYN